MNTTASDSGWKILVQMMMQQQARLLLALMMTTIAAACELLPYWVVFQALDALLQATNTELSSRLLTLATWMALAILCKAVFYAVAYLLSHQAAYAILMNTRQTLVNRLAWAPLDWLQQRSSGDLKQSILQDVENIETVVSHHTIEVFAAILTPLMVTTYLFWVDWRLALAALITVPLAILASALFMRGSSDQYDEYSRVSAAIEGAMVEYLRNMPVMKVFRQDANTFQSMRQRLENYYDVVGDITKRTVPGWALFSSLLGANIFFILPVGAWLYTGGMVSLSQVLLFVILGSGMLKPLLKVSRFFMEINEVLAGIRRLVPILELEQQASKPRLEITAPVTVTFESVCFRYDRQYHNNNTLDDIDLILPPGSFTILLGASGAGKSTLAQLLAGLLLPESGRISLNDIAVTDISNAQRVSLIAVATQEAFLFKGSIKENLLLARPEASDIEIAAAVRAAQAEALIEALPKGYNTHLNEQGVRLSGGERQRIAIARALLADTAVLVLDEASASLDNIAQQDFYKAVRSQYPNKSILMIAHRCYGLEGADQIVVMENGKIKAVGDHQALLSSNAYYQRLWQRQFECNNWTIGANNETALEVIDG